MKRVSILFLLFLLSASQFAEAFDKPVPGRVVFIQDGDTLVISPKKGNHYTCRLYGIDAPETPHEGVPGQPYGGKSAENLSRLVRGKRVEVILTGEKTYGREVCILLVGGEDINLQMIKSGLAWAYRKHLKEPYRESYIEAEEEAREKGVGLWADGDVLSPTEFKRENWE